MLKINTAEAKARLSEYLQRVEQGETILVCRRNIPIAELRPIRRPRGQPEIGFDRGRFEVDDAFFEPLPEWMLAGFEGDPR
jgi:prevent-host-death family protein